MFSRKSYNAFWSGALKLSNYQKEFDKTFTDSYLRSNDEI